MQTAHEPSGGPRAGAAPQAPPAASAAASPLTDDHYALIRQATRDRKAVKSAARTALFSAATTLFIGVSALPFALIWPSLSSLVIVAGVCVIGGVELMGSRRMRQADPRAPAMLAENQLAFLGLIVLYCIFQALTFSTDAAKAAALSPEVRAQLAAMPEMASAIDKQVELWAPVLTYGFYALVAVLSIACQGGMALYYFTRRRHIEAFNAKTPEWIRRLFVAAGA